MDHQFWIYLVLGIIYLLSRAMKKAGQQAKERSGPEQNSGYPSSSPEKRGSLTFEELLREITEAKQAPKPMHKVPPQSETGYVDYEEQIGEEAQDLEEPDKRYGNRNRRYDLYEEGKRQAFERPSLEETLKGKESNVQFGKFRSFEEDRQQNLLEAYTRDFHDPAGLKKAFVLSEILNRKF